MSAQERNDDHPLAPLGYRRPPFWLWRTSQRLYVIVAAIKDIWLIITGRCSLHRAYQQGCTDGSMTEYKRVVINGGDLCPILREVVDAACGPTAEHIRSKVIADAWTNIRAKRVAENSWMVGLQGTPAGADTGRGVEVGPPLTSRSGQTAEKSTGA